MTTKLTDDFLRAFSLPQVAMLHTLAMEMDTYGLTAADVIFLCEEKLEAQRQPQQKNIKNKPAATAAPQNNKKSSRLSTMRCPDCREYLLINPVCPKMPGNWKSSLECSNPKCRYTELSSKTRGELLD